MEWILTLLLVVVLAAIVFWLWRRSPGKLEARREPWEPGGETSGTRLTLDIGTSEPDHPSVQRLVREAAHRALAADPSLDEVEVVDRDGRVLGVERRPEPLPEVSMPPTSGQRTPRRHAPSPVPHEQDLHPRAAHEPAPEVRAVALADRLDLAEEIRRRVAEPDRAVDIVRAILEAAGRPVEVHGDLLVSGDVAIAVVDVRGDAERALTHGFLRIKSTDARRGMVLRLGYVDPAIVRRREAAAPHVRHVGPDAIQRMADAAAVGGDPITFAAGPALR